MLRKVFRLFNLSGNQTKAYPHPGIEPVFVDLDVLMRDRMESEARVLVRRLKQRGIFLARLISGNSPFTKQQIIGIKVVIGVVAVQSCCIEAALNRGEVYEVLHLGVLKNAALSIKKIDIAIKGSREF